MTVSKNKVPANRTRREVVKSLTVGSGAITTLAHMPDSWIRPVVESVVLPAHAQISFGCGADELVTGSTTAFGFPIETTATTVSGPFTVARTGNSFGGTLQAGALDCADGMVFGDFSGVINTTNDTISGVLILSLMCDGVTVCDLEFNFEGDRDEGDDTDGVYSVGGTVTTRCCPGFDGVLIGPARASARGSRDSAWDLLMH